MLRNDFLDADHWAELAKALGLRLPLWRQPPTRGQMSKWLRKLGVSLTQYQEWSGDQTLEEFAKRNPSWPLRAWVGMLLEQDAPADSTQSLRLDSQEHPTLGVNTMEQASPPGV